MYIYGLHTGLYWRCQPNPNPFILILTAFATKLYLLKYKIKYNSTLAETADYRKQENDNDQTLV
jgi:hypothetical protein